MSGGTTPRPAAFDIVVSLRRMFEPYADRLAVAFIFGSVARGTDTAQSDIDLMIIGELDYDTVYAVTDEAGRRLGRPVSPVLMSTQDWRRESAMRDRFVSGVRRSPRLMLFGSEDEL